MKKKVFVLFSHNLLEDQVIELKSTYKVTDIVRLPLELQNLWGNIPPEPKDILEIIEPIKKWLKAEASVNDLVIVQGDFGVTFNIINWCLEQDFIPIYATSKRVHKEEYLPDGTIKISKNFKHVQFRKYQK
ncbi:hypothetical protein H0I29_01320 [Polaribacter sp. R2A056_3_33]|uniref:CRISPR-associated protein Csx20 n=1 Tax=Polaribacter sp. R2A056_3_33 TaxID=2745563 RepID=UPI001C4EE1ED|nr:CRISPR-associated protein Csx20 [Polaribacter sp. R2A056_3_33]QXP70765.1 hypothetical protein H0I29_01320 [Polaribacter sp. R2A056_3_33]